MTQCTLYCDISASGQAKLRKFKVWIILQRFRQRVGYLITKRETMGYGINFLPPQASCFNNEPAWERGGGLKLTPEAHRDREEKRTGQGAERSEHTSERVRKDGKEV